MLRDASGEIGNGTEFDEQAVIDAEFVVLAIHLDAVSRPPARHRAPNFWQRLAGLVGHADTTLARRRPAWIFEETKPAALPAAAIPRPRSPQKKPDPAAPWAKKVRHLVPGGEQMGAYELEFWVLELTRSRRGGR